MHPSIYPMVLMCCRRQQGSKALPLIKHSSIDGGIDNTSLSTPLPSAAAPSYNNTML